MTRPRGCRGTATRSLTTRSTRITSSGNARKVWGDGGDGDETREKIDPQGIPGFQVRGAGGGQSPPKSGGGGEGLGNGPIDRHH